MSTSDWEDDYFEREANDFSMLLIQDADAFVLAVEKMIQLVSQHEAQLRFERDRSVVDRMIRTGVLLEPLQFGAKSRFYLKEEVDAMERMLDDNVPMVERKHLVTELRATRHSLIDGVCNAIRLVRTESAAWLEKFGERLV